MRITTDRISVLLNYGLSEYQARAYLALLEFPSLNAGTLAKVAQIPRNRLYEVLEDLQTAGLVEIILDEGTRKYRAKPLADHLDRLVGDLRERISSIESRKEYLAIAFQPPALNTPSDLEFGSTRVVIGRRAVTREIDRLLDDARESVIASSTAGGVERIIRQFTRHADLFQGADGDRLTAEILIPRRVAATSGVERMGEPLAASVRWLDFEPSVISVVADLREMITVQPIPDDDRQQSGRDFAILSTNPSFVKDRVDLLRRAAAEDVVATRAVKR